MDCKGLSFGHAGADSQLQGAISMDVGQLLSAVPHADTCTCLDVVARWLLGQARRKSNRDRCLSCVLVGPIVHSPKRCIPSLAWQWRVQSLRYLCGHIVTFVIHLVFTGLAIGQVVTLLHDAGSNE